MSDGRENEDFAGIGHNDLHCTYASGKILSAIINPHKSASVDTHMLMTVAMDLISKIT